MGSGWHSSILLGHIGLDPPSRWNSWARGSHPTADEAMEEQGTISTPKLEQLINIWNSAKTPNKPHCNSILSSIVSHGRIDIICQSDYCRLRLQLLKFFFFSFELGIVYTERKKILQCCFTDSFSLNLFCFNFSRGGFFRSSKKEQNSWSRYNPLWFIKNARISHYFSMLRWKFSSGV